MAGESCLLSEDDRGEKYKLASIASYLLIIVIGLPIWWKTTEVYRVSLPYDDIHRLAENDMTLPVTVEVLLDEGAEPSFLDELPKVIHFDSKLKQFEIVVNWQTQDCDLTQVDILSKSADIAEVDSNLFSATSTGNITIIILSKHSSLLRSKMYIGVHRNVFIKKSNDMSSDILSAFNTIVNPSQLQQSFNRLIHRQLTTSDADKESMKSVFSSSAVDITFTLFLPEASLVDVSWDIESAVNEYLQPFAKTFEPVLNFNTRSQIFYLTKLDIRTKLDGKTKQYILSTDQLPHLINPIEVKLGSHVTMNPSLNFVVYVAPSFQTPLQMVDSFDIPSPLNSMLIHRWGGFMIYNIDQSKSEQRTIDMQHVFGVFLLQLRTLLGIPHRENSESEIHFGALNQTLIRQWEFDSAIRMRLVENLLKATSTLNSLAQLLEKISNIVIADHVGQQIFDATNFISQSYAALSESDIARAFQYSKNAVVSSEVAFFDPSMLALLYFPEDQKYAIYVPLFLPMSIPIVLSIKFIFNWVKKRREARSDQSSIENKDKYD
ncbi:hypothetical protein CHUAL_005736 [Chamberlinius hualienensis]